MVDERLPDRDSSAPPPAPGKTRVEPPPAARLADDPGVGEPVVPQDHAFAPLTFYDANGENPIETDWCGYLVTADEVCGQVAATHRPPADVLTQVLDRVWCAATDATRSPDFTRDADRERYRLSVFLQARSALAGLAHAAPVARDPDGESTRAGWLIAGLTRRFTTELIRDPLVPCSPDTDMAVRLLAERLATAAYGVVAGRPHPLAGLLEQIRWSADQSTWPAHLRDDAPRQQCDRCRRFTWAVSEFGQVCRMTQPSGQPCGGRFVPPFTVGG